jgi:hypothetical protein
LDSSTEAPEVEATVIRVLVEVSIAAPRAAALTTELLTGTVI